MSTQALKGLRRRFDAQSELGERSETLFERLRGTCSKPDGY